MVLVNYGCLRDDRPDHARGPGGRPGRRGRAAAPGRAARGRRGRARDARRLELARGRRGARRHAPGGPQEARQAADRRGRRAQETLMFERFTKDARRSSATPSTIARELGATSVEAEHLLLAVDPRRRARRGRAARRAGSTTTALSAALAMETERSLAAVGVTRRRAAFSPFVEKPRLATSAKAALEMSLRIVVERAATGGSAAGTWSSACCARDAAPSRAARWSASARVDSRRSCPQRSTRLSKPVRVCRGGNPPAGAPATRPRHPTAPEPLCPHDQEPHRRPPCGHRRRRRDCFPGHRSCSRAPGSSGST